MFELYTHPCFNEESKHKYSRVHLPVAPNCNIQCNYCNRKYDCVNESRPGVTSAVLKPYQAIEYLKIISGKLNNISVVGIAGPGDPFANPEETLETMRLVRREFPDVLLCVSTNGLNIAPYIDELKKLNLSHVTLTINGFDPEILARIYSWVRFGKRVYRGIEAGEVMIRQQTEALKLLKEAGLTVKVNTIVIPSVNEHTITNTAAKLAEFGTDMMNCIPLLPAKDTPFENLKEPVPGLIKQLRKETAEYIKPMNHCSRCRADAAGLLGENNEETKCILQKLSMLRPKNAENRNKVAVATYENMLVNQHLGEASDLAIFGYENGEYVFLETRNTPPSGSGDKRWTDLGEILSDCRALLVSGIGPKPSKILERSGIEIIQMTGLIQAGLEAVFEGKPLKTVTRAEMFACGSSCSGKANGCM